MGKNKRRRASGLAAAALAGAVLLAAAVVLVVSTGASSAPSQADQNAMKSTIEAYWQALGEAGTPDDTARKALLAKAPLSQSTRDAIDAKFRAALAKVATPALVDSLTGGTGGPSTSVEADRNVGLVITRSDSSVVSLTYMRTLKNGDAVVRAQVWLGEVHDKYASGAVGVGEAVTGYVDNLPTYRYQMRKVDGKWMIVTEALVYSSEDTAGGEANYGPQTPHWIDSTPVVTGDEGLVL